MVLCRDWLFHPSIRAYAHPNAKASVYRYPAPGNATKPPLAGEAYTDYKTPYEHTTYNVRYARPTPAQRGDQILEFKFDSTAVNEIQKYPLRDVDSKSWVCWLRARRATWTQWRLRGRSTSRKWGSRLRRRVKAVRCSLQERY